MTTKKENTELPISMKKTPQSPDFRALFESVPGLYLSLDPTLHIVAVTDAYARATMTRREDILGRDIFEVFPDNPDDPQADGVRNLKASLMHVLQSLTADAMAVQKYDIRKPDSEGGGFEVRYWSPLNSPVLKEDGTLAYIIHRVEDVTEFIQLKQQGIEQSKVTEELRERMVRMEADIYARSHDVAEANTKLKQTGELLRQAKEKTEHASRIKDSFLATMSHEIRTPLSGLLGMLELLSLTELNSDQNKILEAALNSGKSLLRILSDILDWSKIEAGKLGLSPQAISLELLLKEVVTTYSHVASAKGLELWQHVDASLSPAHLGDSMRLSQILNNFVSNAIKFTNKGEVEVYAELLEKKDGAELVRFSVRDTGIGLNQEQQAGLFLDFTQATATTARMYGGTGLGLAICRRLVNLMHGRLDLVSTPNSGSTFSITLTLPVTDIEPRQYSVIDSVKPIVQDGASNHTVLVVDDHPINLTLLAKQIEMLGLRAKSAEDGEAALKIWREGGVSLVITDVHMPRMDGYDLAAAIRSIEIAEVQPRTPIIANTANALSEENERCLAAGMDDVMVKPTILAKLRATILRWLPELNGSTVAGPAAETAKVDVDTPIDRIQLQNIMPDSAGQITLLKNFKLHQHTDLDKLAGDLAKGDIAGAALTAHRLKGASRVVGAKDLARVYAAIEQAAKENDLKSVQTMMQTLDVTAGRFEAYLAEQFGIKEKYDGDK